MTKVFIVPGPSTDKLSKAAAEEKLTRDPSFPKGADYAVTEVDGRWVAAFVHQAAPPFPPEGSSEPAAEEEPSTPPSEDDGASADGEDKPFGEKKEEGGDKPGGEKKEHGEGGGELAKIEHMLTTLLTALGLGGPDASPIPGEEVGPPAPPEGEPGPPSPHGDSDVDPRDNKTHTVHERALKPGEAPPGTTPVGSPSFASVSVPEDHPWRKEIISGQAEWVVEDSIGADEKISTIAQELKRFAEPYGYRVKQLKEAREDGRRIARAKISR